MHEHKLKIIEYMGKKVIVMSNYDNDEPLKGILDGWTSALDKCIGQVHWTTNRTGRA